MTEQKSRNKATSSRGQGYAQDAQDKPTIRIFLVRHGQSEQHIGKIFLGQADVPLSERGKNEAELAGEKLANLDAQPKRIYTSDLARAKETAVIIAERLGGIPVVQDKLFREMAMGTWDGELIEDIKAKFPGEYEKRGNDIRNYRTPGGENFYDLHGRVTREFHRIFAEDFRNAYCKDGSIISNTTYNTNNIIFSDSAGHDPGDLLIVAHLGVITALAEELLSDAPEDGFWTKGFATGSVTVFDVPDWLWA